MVGYARGGWVGGLLGLFGALVMGSAGVLLTAAPADAAPAIHAVSAPMTLVVRRGALQCLWNLPSDYNSHAYVCGPVGAGAVTVTTMGDPASFDASVACPTMIGAN